MKTLLLFLLSTCFFIGANSQIIDYDRETYWNIGFGFGASYEDNDLNCNDPGFGATFTIGKSIYESPKHFFGLDVNYRFLIGEHSGFNTELTTDNINLVNDIYPTGTFLNYETFRIENSLELGLNFHSLRESTGVIFGVFGGVGITYSENSTNLLNDLSNPYNYSSINTNQSDPDIKDDLDFLIDESFETEIIDRAYFTPTIGAKLGYQISPSLSFLLEHKVTFSLKDEIDGLESNGGQFFGDNDAYHYTSVGLGFNILKGRSHTTETRPDDPDCEKPEISIISPENGITTENQVITFEARLENIRSAKQLTVRVNGIKKNATYYELGKKVVMSVTLEKGYNKISILTQNECGTAKETIHVTYKEKDCPKPKIVDISPANNFSTTAETIVLNVITKNVSDASQVTLKVNGSKQNVSFNQASQKINQKIDLQLGTNIIQIEIENECGRISEDIIINRNNNTPPPCLAPIVLINSPLNNTTSEVDRINVKAFIQNFSSTTNIQVTHNGNTKNVTNQSNLYFNVNLIEGSNTILIKAMNSCGSDTKVVTIIYKPKTPCNTPVVTINYPQNNFRTKQASINVQGLIQNFTSNTNLSITHNNSTVNTARQANLSFLVNLQEGTNIIQVKVNNECGSDIKTITIIREVIAPCLAPQIIVTSPTNFYTTNNSSVTISGRVNNFTNGTTLYINGQRFYTQNFVTQIPLNVGVNTIQIQTTNECGNDTEVITVTRKKCVIPAISISQPLDGSITQDNSLSIIAYSNNATNVSLKVNGYAKSIQYSPTTGKITGNILLNDGINTIEITATNNCGNSVKTITITKNIPCVKPIVLIQAPVNNATTSKANYEFRATIQNITNSNQVQLKVNNQTVATTLYNQSIKQNIKLKAGNNIIQLTASNECGSETKTIYIVYNCEKPKINFINHPENSAFNNIPTANVNARIINVINPSNITVRLRGTLISHNYNLSTQTISLLIDLIEGDNILEIKAVNGCGEDIQTLNIRYKKPCVTPTVSIITPINNQVVKNSIIPFQAKTTNIDSPSSIVVKINGTTATHTFDVGSGLVKSNIVAKSGDNNISIEVTNACGKDVKNVSFNYNPCSAPTITIKKPLNGSTLSINQLDFEAITTNIGVNDKIQVAINESNVNHSFISNKVVVFYNQLKIGSNAIVISVENECGKDIKTIFVTYKKPCVSPTVNIVKYQSSLQVNNPNLPISATTTNITQKSQVKFTLNGSNVNFNFNANNVSTNLQLKEGQNTVIIQATNSCGTDSKQIIVTYKKPCVSPTVNIVKYQSSLQVNNPNLPISATTTNITQKSQVKFTLNGSNVNFNFNANNVSANLQLKEGQNTVIIQATNSCGTDSKQIIVTYKKPCVSPTVNIVKYQSSLQVNNPNLPISATVTEINQKSQIKFMLNGSNVNFNFNANNVSANLQLKEGQNTVIIQATNSCGTDSKQIIITYKKPCVNPTVNIENNQSSLQVSNPNLSIAATVTEINQKSQIKFTLNGSNVSFNLYGNKVSANLQLKEGQNTVIIQATNSCGTDSKQIIITYKKPCVSPTVNIENNQSSLQVSNPNLSIAATVTEINQKSQIKFTLNGSNVNFNLYGNKVSANLQLKEGQNTVIIQATNSCGTDSKQIIITYKKPCVSPTVNIVKYQSSLQVNNPNLPISATTTNITQKSQIKFTLNGSNVSFNFNANNVSANLQLKEGQNTVIIQATNRCGTDKKQIIVTYKKPCVSPTVDIITPNNKQVFAKAGILMQAKTTNITDKSQIRVTNNGKSLSFIFRNNMITVDYNIDYGANDIVVQVTNACGSQTDNIKVYYNIPSPSINIKNPKSSNTTTNTNTFNINGDIKNQVNEFEVYLNGKELNSNDVKLDGSNSFDFNINLLEGVNTIEFIAKGTGGTDKEKITINYKKPIENQIEKGLSPER